MNRSTTGNYHTTATAGEQVRAFVPLPLPPVPPLEIAGERSAVDQRLILALFVTPLGDERSSCGLLTRRRV